MISLGILFYFMVIFFGVVGYLRGWQREVIALSGLVFSIAFLSQFGDDLARLVGSLFPPQSTLEQRNFWIQAVFHSFVAIVGYHVVSRVADRATGGRLTERIRADLQKRILGAFVGLFNGYLFFGGLWGFLEYRLSDAGGYVQLGPNEMYPFGDVITRPLADTLAATIANSWLPQGLGNPTIWLLIFFATFFIVLLALI